MVLLGILKQMILIEPFVILTTIMGWLFFCHIYFEIPKYQGEHTRNKNEIRALPTKRVPGSDEYKNKMDLITKKTATAQALLIEKYVHCRLFKAATPTAVVYDHGSSLGSELFML